MLKNHNNRYSIAHINVTANRGSTGKIVNSISNHIESLGLKSQVFYGRKNSDINNKEIRIGDNIGQLIHLLTSRIFDNQGLCSATDTNKFIDELASFKPDIVHLHNIHGYYINYQLLFNSFKNNNTNVVWTLHDCWPFTGHCIYYDNANCSKWQSQCASCPQTRTYPASYVFDRSRDNYNDKKNAFSNLKNLKIVVPSNWLAGELKQSFLADYDCRVINNGIDLKKFRVTRSHINNRRKIVLGVANVWEDRKGLNDMIELSKSLSDDTNMVLIGLSKKQILSLPKGITGLERTNDINELVEWYNKASAFINPTYEDNFPTTNLESLACGTPVITYKTGGSHESIDECTGHVVNRGDIRALIKSTHTVLDLEKGHYVEKCRNRAVIKYDVNDMTQKYSDLYMEMVGAK